MTNNIGSRRRRIPEKRKMLSQHTHTHTPREMEKGKGKAEEGGRVHAIAQSLDSETFLEYLIRKLKIVEMPATLIISSQARP